MRPQYSILAHPIIEPVSYDEASDHLRVDSQDDIELITGLIPVCREMIDGMTGRASTLARWRLVAGSWCALRDPSASPFKLQLYRTPLVSVEAVKYYDEDNALQTMAAQDYLVITTTEPGCVILTGSRPSLFNRPDAIQIEFTAGHVEPCDVSPMHRHAIKMMVHHLYEERSPVNIGNITSELPWTLAPIINQIKVGGWCA